MSSPMIDFPFLSFSISYINMVFLKVISEDLSRPLEKLLAQSTRLLEYQKKSRAFGSKIHATDENVNDMSAK